MAEGYIGRQLGRSFRTVAVQFLWTLKSAALGPWHDRSWERVRSRPLGCDLKAAAPGTSSERASMVGLAGSAAAVQ